MHRACAWTPRGREGGEGEFIESAYACLRYSTRKSDRPEWNEIPLWANTGKVPSILFFSLAQPELAQPPPLSIYTIFVQPESRVIEMASLFPRERNEISSRECSFCTLLPFSHERIDGISFFSGAGSNGFDLISNREGSDSRPSIPPPPPEFIRPKFFRYNSSFFVSSSLFLSLCSQFRRIYLALAHRRARYPFWRVKTLPSRVKLPGDRHLVCSGDARKVVSYL